jgi:hypothetical protein
VIFDLPAVARFREQLGATLGLGSGWDPAALSPVMFVALADSTLPRWLPSAPSRPGTASLPS